MRSRSGQSAASIFFCPHDPAEHEPYARKCHTVAPHLIFRAVGIRVFQPLCDLLVGFHFAAGHIGVGLKHLVPEIHFLISRLFRAEVGAPVVREALEPGAFGWCQPADGVSALDSTRSFCHQCRLKLLFKGRSELGVLPLVEGISADAVANGSRVFIVPCHDGGRGFFLHLRIAAGGHGIDGVSVHGIERKRDLLVDTVTLRTVFVLTTNHGALNGIALHNSDAALIAGGVTVVAIERPCGFGFVDAAAGIIRLHGI